MVIIDKMRVMGCEPDAKLYSPLSLHTMKDEEDQSINDKISEAENQMSEWKKYMEDLYNDDDCTQEVKYLISFFSGRNLIKLDQNNLNQFFKFINPNVKLSDLNFKGIYLFSNNKKTWKIFLPERHHHQKQK